MTTHLTSMLLWETLQTYHGSKDFRCGLMSLDASVSAAILFPPFSPPPPPPTYHGSKDFRWGLVSLDASVSAAILFPPLPPPPSPFRPIMDQRIKVWPCVSRCFCVCYHSLPSPSSPPPRPIMNQRISGVALCLSMLLCLLPFSSLPSHFMNPLFFTKRGDSAINSFIIKAVCYITVFELLMKIPREPRACRCFEVRF